MSINSQLPMQSKTNSLFVPSKIISYGVMVGIFLTIIMGALADLVDVDAAQYASISMEMLQTGNFLHITERGEDYLDKPPFLFWTAALSFQFLGYTNLAYKLFTILFSLLGIWATYRLGKYLYNESTGKIAAILLISSIGFFWSNNDVKTDVIVMSTIVISVYSLLMFWEYKKFLFLLLAAIFVAIGMMTKGPMALVFPLVYISIFLFTKKRWADFFSYFWLIFLGIIAIILFPMCLGLYEQFDLHPEKIVNGKTGVSGLRFFFWEQSFGRITGENVWKNDTSFFFLYHTLLILVFPYTLLVIHAYFTKFSNIIKRKKEENLVAFIGSIIVLSMLSLSSYKIPHYAIAVLPFVLITAASEIANLFDSPPKWLYIHNTIIAILVYTFITLCYFSFKIQWFSLVISCFLVGLFLLARYYNLYAQSLVIVAISLGFTFNSQLIPGLHEYTTGRRLANLIKESQLNVDNIYFFNTESRATEFYLQKRIKKIDWGTVLQLAKTQKNAWFYMNEDAKKTFVNSGLKINKELSLVQYDINRIKLKFLNPYTRTSKLSTNYLVQF